MTTIILKRPSFIVAVAFAYVSTHSCLASVGRCGQVCFAPSSARIDHGTTSMNYAKSSKLYASPWHQNAILGGSIFRRNTVKGRNCVLSCTKRIENQDVPASFASRATIARQSKPKQKAGGNERNLLVLGVCGGIASGKSKACQILTTPPTEDDSSVVASPTQTKSNPTTEELCCFDGGCIPIVGHIDVDKLAHTVYEPGSPIISEIVSAFGKNVMAPDGTIDRAALGSIVFSDRSKMSELEDIVWPHVKNKLVQKLDDLEQSISRKTEQQSQATQQTDQPQAIAVVEAAMLLESGWDDMLDAVWVVRTPEGMALDRMVTHRNMDPDDALKRIEAQSARKGICPTSLSEALDEQIVTAVIENDSDSLEKLTQKLQQAWNDPQCWKEGCCPI